ncbi:hypothetical protein BKA56DRAFT_479052 [Ilyonectria sp. MPI-CAGE-AT-0026]|nr:hypothetical protein BKA56DRAFT_479052 [Ilyonectria sp. MPI-CAGE-AT-0026]
MLEAQHAALQQGAEFHPEAYLRAERLRATQNDAPKPSRAWVATMKVPFLDTSPMIGPASCTEQAFEEPLLRHCVLDPSTLVFEKRLGGGLDGFVWKVRFGNKGPFALKLFWDNPPESEHYYAAQRECHNAAIFQMMEASLAKATADSRSIQVHANPRTQDDAMDNLFAFCDDAQMPPDPKSPFITTIEPGSSNTTSITSMPRLRKCYGWLKLGGEVFDSLPRRLQAHPYTVSKITRSISSSEEYTVLIYEYVEEGENDPAVVEEVDRFFWLAGFSHTFSPAARNWKNGVLIDLSDMIEARGYGWLKMLYGPWEASQILVE